MNQYFERLIKATNNEQMPIRIRFMIQDVIDLRRNKWQPRRIGKGPDGPRTIQQVREDAARDGCIYMPQENSPPTSLTKVPNPMTLINPLEGNFFDNKNNLSNGLASSGSGPASGNSAVQTGGGGINARRQKDPMEDIFGVTGGYSPYLGTGPGTINQFEMDNDYDTSSSNSSSQRANDKNNRRGSSGSRQSPTVNDGINPEGRRKAFPRTSQQSLGGGPGQRDHHHRSNQDPPPRGGGGGGPPGGPRDPRDGPNRNLPDFGDRYSANRTKDRLRREQQKQGRGHHGSPPQSQGPDQRPDRSNSRPWSNMGEQPNRYASSNSNASNDMLAPRFKKMILQPEHEASNHEVSLKPTTSSMIFKPKTPSLLPKSAKPNNNILDPAPSLLPPGTALPPASGKVMQAPILIENKKHNKAAAGVNAKKGATREEVFAKVEAVLESLLSKESTNEAVEQWKEAAVPNPMTQTALNHLYKAILDKGQPGNDLVLAFVSQLCKEGVISSVHCNEAFLKMIGSSHNSEDMALIACGSIVSGVSDLKEVAEATRG